MTPYWPDVSVWPILKLYQMMIRFAALVISCVICLDAFCTGIYIHTVEYIRKLSIRRANEDAFAQSNKFTIRGRLLNEGSFSASYYGTEPVYAYLVLNDTLYSEPFFIDNRVSKMEVTVDKESHVSVINSEVQAEYLHKFIPAMQKVNDEIADFFSNTYRPAYIQYNGKIPDSLADRFDSVRSGLREKSFASIRDYITNHPNSYVAMWRLLDELLNYGYKDKLQQAYGQFSSGIRNSRIGKVVGKKLAQMQALEPGNIFPNLLVKDTNLTRAKLINALRGQHILVDFWYSNCYPCIVQFPLFKEILTAYSNLQIILISTDKAQDVEKWKQTMIKYELPFVQFLDENGAQSDSVLNIRKFPTNFLLDAKGKIITRDISPNALRKLLQ